MNNFFYRRRIYRRRYPYRTYFRRKYVNRYTKSVSQQTYYLKYDVSCEVRAIITSNDVRQYLIFVDDNIYGRQLYAFDFLTACDLGYLFNYVVPFKNIK